jgi:hypothetical protein
MYELSVKDGRHHSRRGEEISDYDEALVDTSDSPEARAEN